MKLLLDATVMEQAATGIAKLTHCLYEQCLALDPTLEAVALHQRPLTLPLPARLRGRRMGGALPPPRWRALALPLLAAAERGILHCPWNGQVPRLAAPLPVVSTLHDLLPLEIPGYFPNDQAEAAFRRRVQQDLARSDLLVTDSHYSKARLLAEFAPPREPLVLYPGPTLPIPLSPPPSEADPPYFLYVGGYDARKGLLPLVAAFLALRRQGALPARLILTGSPRPLSPTFSRQVQEGVAAGWIEERGYVSDEALVRLYQGALALVYPSLYEGFGLPVLEAMALGCPVLTTRATSLAEVGGNAILPIDPDPASLAPALREIAARPELRADLRARGYQQAARFRWSDAAQQFLAALATTFARSPTR